MANHIRSESEWGIAEPPAIQQVVVNVGSLFAVDVERGRQHTGGNGGFADTHVRWIAGTQVRKMGMKWIVVYYRVWRSWLSLVMLQRFPCKYPLRMQEGKPNSQLISIPRNPRNVVTIGELSEDENDSEWNCLLGSHFCKCEKALNTFSQNTLAFKMEHRLGIHIGKLPPSIFVNVPIPLEAYCVDDRDSIFSG